MSLALLEPHANPELLGQEAPQAALLRAWRSGRLPHGWLFEGRFGMGKATLAYRFARFLLAGGGERLELPPDHPVVGPVAAGAHPDLVRIVAKDPRQSGKRVRAEIGVDAVREAIAAMHRTGVGRHRVLVVDEAHRMNVAAANALLKTLEEPGPGVVVILAAESAGRLPATIRSRVAPLRLQPVEEARIADWLTDRHGVEPAPAATVAALAGGSPGLAAWLLAHDAVGHYGALVEVLAGARGEPGVARVVACLETMLEVGEAALARELVGQLVRRAVAFRFGAAAAPLAADEPAVLARQAGRLDRLWEVWDKLAVLDVVAERLSLDRQALLVDIAASLAADGATAA